MQGYRLFVSTLLSSVAASVSSSASPSASGVPAEECLRRWQQLEPSEKQRFARLEAETDAVANATRTPAPPICSVDLLATHQYVPSASSDTTTPAERTKDETAEEQERSSSSTGFNFYEPLKLDNIRSSLIRLEESIIFALIERSQFRRNSAIYDPQTMPQFKGLSFIEYFLHETEKLHATVRRYTSPDEHPFFPRSTLPDPVLPLLQYPRTIKPNDININDRVYKFYVESVVPSICQPGDDQNHGSCANCDIQALQVLSKRIHYGKFVAESKFQAEPELFRAAIERKDVGALTELITKPTVEEQVLERVRLKAATYGTEPSLGHSAAPGAPSSAAAGSRSKISPNVITSIYVQVMTLNKEVQIAYLLQRL